MYTKKFLTDMPIINCSNFILRPIESQDATDMFEYCSDLKVVQNLTFTTHSSVRETKKCIDTLFLTRPSNNMPAVYAICFKENNKMIGTCNFGAFNTENKYATIGYALNRKYWNKGIMTEAVQNLIKVGFEYLKLKRISVTVKPNNAKSKKVIEKCGFTPEGIQYNTFFVKNKTEDILIYAITKNSYFKNKLPWQKQTT